MRTVILLSLLLGVVLSSLILGYPPMYYIYMAHEILFLLLFLWFFSTFVLKKYSDLLEMLTLFLVFFFLILSPVTKGLAPDYTDQYTGDPIIHVDYLAAEIGERPYMSDNERKAAHYIQQVLKEKGFSPTVDENVIVLTEGIKEEAVIFCAHYDTVPGSPGADDNASGVSVLLELNMIESPEYTIVLAFFSGEECGLVESGYFSYTFDREIVGVICVDTVGVGEDFHISSLKENRFTSFFLSQVVYGLSDTGVPSIGPLYSDHVPFNRKGIRAIGLTRSTNRKYPHIHSEKDVTADNAKLTETGDTVQKVVYHFSHSETPYLFVYETLLLTATISGALALGFHGTMDRLKVQKEYS